jgi:hypothetical protein
LEYQLINKYINKLFTNQPSNLIQEQLDKTQEGSIIQNCIEKLTSIGLDTPSIKKICIDSPLKYIPPIVQTFLDGLWITIKPDTPITVEKFVTFEIDHDGNRDVHHWEYITKQGVQNIYKNDQHYNSRDPMGLNINATNQDLTYGKHIFDFLYGKATQSEYKIIYISIHAKLAKIGNMVFHDQKVRLINGNDVSIKNFFHINGVDEEKFNSLFTNDGEDDIHSTHALTILFIIDSDGTVIIRIMNSWGDCATHMDLTPALFIWLLDNNIIFSLTWFRVFCNTALLMGGKNTKKIRHNKKRTNRRNKKRTKRRNKKRTNKRKIR